MRSELHDINRQAHLRTMHPSGLDWPEQVPADELDFLSRVAFDAPGHSAEAVVYLAKELAQLAEIERHVSTVMTHVMAEVQADPRPLGDGFELQHALSCFAAEELQHASMFYRHVRLLSGRDFKCPDNRFRERVAVYHGDDSPYVKLSALCCSAYIGESIITVFERRLRALDPKRTFFFTQVLHAHGLDEARHVKFDHFLFDHVVPALSRQERRRMREILERTEALNTEMARRVEAHARATFGLDYTAQNLGHETQLRLSRAFRGLMLDGEIVRKVDDGMSEADRRLVREFCHAETIHGPG
ncbi:diiron oxygenase [Sorangium sp. So ce1335]|uniref:diiron oxygenase n=1 Tax=Sorangium sp. So ce1335 TaxID=3133335 RepID=UPI003F648EC7